MSEQDIINHFNNVDTTYPEPIPLQRSLPKPEPFPVNALGGELAAFALKITEVVQAPLAISSQSVLAAVALAVQAYADVYIDGRRIPTSEFFVTIGASGERKSAIDSLVLSPHRAHQDELRQIYDTEHLRWQLKNDAYESAKKDFLRKHKTLTEKNLISEHLGYPPTRPLSPIILTEEPTYEGLTKLYTFGQPSLGLFSDEGGRFVGGHGMNQDNILKTSAGLSSLWDGKPTSRVRAGEESFLLCGKRLSFHLMAQPQIAQLMLANKILLEQGLLSRCLISYPESTAGNRLYKEIDITKTMEYKNYILRVSRILKTPLPIAQNKRNELAPRTLSISKEAKSYFIGFHDDIEQQLGEGGEYFPIRGFANKAPEHALRLAGILSLFYDIECNEISLEFMAAGINLAQYYLSESLRLFHSSSADPEIVQAELLLNWLHKTNRTVTFLSEIYQLGPNSIRNAKMVSNLMLILVDHNWAYPLGDGIVVDKIYRKKAWKILKN